MTSLGDSRAAAVNGSEEPTPYFTAFVAEVQIGIRVMPDWSRPRTVQKPRRSFSTFRSPSPRLPPHLPPLTKTSPPTMKFTSAFATLLLSASTILAAPVEFTPRDVWVPKILSPDATTVWQVGKTYNVTWSLDQKPENVTNPNGTVYLSKNGRLNISAFPSLYLFGWTETDNPLIFLFLQPTRSLKVSNSPMQASL
jgi:hypothetical protein